MRAAKHALKPTDDLLALLSDDVRRGLGCIAQFNGPLGRAWMEIRGPKGMRTAPDFMAAPVPTLRLWVPGRTSEPAAVAVANRDFDSGLRAIEETARPHVFPGEMRLLAAVLQVVREASDRKQRARVPPVGDRLTEEGVPRLEAWASCLTLGDLEAAVLKALARAA